MNELIQISTITATGIEESKALKIKATFEPMVELLLSFEERYNDVMSESNSSITKEITAKAKRLRLDIGKVRIETGKIKDKQKEYIKLEDKAIMGAHNILVYAVKEKEDKLKDIETHFEKLEQERLEKLQADRVERISPYLDNAEYEDFSGMKDDVWSAYFEAKKKAYEDRIAAEKKAEAERIENERLDKIENERHLKILPYRQFWKGKSIDLRTMETNDFEKLFISLVDSQNKYDEEQEEIRKENERMKKEREEAEKVRKKAIAKRARSAISYLLTLGFEICECGVKTDDCFIGSNHYSEFDTDKELEMFKAEAKANIDRDIEKKKADKIAADKKARLEKVEAELKTKKEKEEQNRIAEEKRVQDELNKGDADKIKDLVSDLISLKTKYSFKFKKNNAMYIGVRSVIDGIIKTIQNQK